MKTIALLPVRNEAWVLRHVLACLSGFCDVVMVCDQGSEDGSREICRTFPKVVPVESLQVSADTTSRLPQLARWRLLDAARDYSGNNLLWISDADELMSPRLAWRWLDAARERLAPGSIVECLFYNLWNSAAAYRDDWTLYRPHWKVMAFADDRAADYPRANVLPLHEPRLPPGLRGETIRAEGLPVLHLQWLIAERNQMKQAWYRCIELLDGRTTSAAINARYAITLLEPFVRTTAVPPEWTADVTFPDFRVSADPSWHEREILAWFDEYSIERFEPLEIWHVRKLRDEFRRRTGRRPRPERSDVRPWPSRARDFGRRAASAAWRRIFA